MNASFEIFPLSTESLGKLFATLSNTPEEDVFDKDHLEYFEEYFEEFDAKTILLERHYIDHDYLDDYAAYYSKCFHAYDRFCSRLHFFTHAFSENEFAAVLLNEENALTAEQLQESYLGFVVVKPLPETFIGRTCLKTYPPEGRRNYPTTRQYDAHLYGIKLSVEAVAFQEQDSTVAMCATSALWSAFHGTGKLFHHAILSPVEITRAATLNSEDPMRSLPNDGLTLEQMARAIRAVSLDPYFVRVDDGYLLRSTVYAYLRGRIPVLIDIDLVEVTNTDSHVLANEVLSGDLEEKDEDDSRPFLKGHKMGSHEVTVVGYSLTKGPATPFEPTGLLLTASKIDKFYAHDDQVGPYSRMEIDEHGFLSTSWRGDESGEIGTVMAAPGNLLAPLYNKIRIPFGVVHDAVLPLDQFLEQLRQEDILSYEHRLEWDIYLTTAADLKEEIHSSSLLEGGYRRELLLEQMPRFLWRATAILDGSPTLDLLFDATDVEKGKLFLRAIEYEPSLSSVLKAIATDETAKETFRRERMGRIMEWFASQN